MRVLGSGPNLDNRHVLTTMASSGAGGGDNGFAGSVSINIVNSLTRAQLMSGSSVTGLTAQPITLRSNSRTTNRAEALPVVKYGRW